MRIIRSTKPNRALTLIEVLVVVTVVIFIAALYVLPPFAHTEVRAPRIQCVNNLKQIGLATRVWEDDHNDMYPPQVSVTNGGSMEFTTGPNVWRTFQVMSNEITTPKVLICPADDRWAATNFTAFCNSNISFFYGVDANEANPMLILSGDRNITNGVHISNGILTLTINQPSGWTAGLHNKVGNLALSDGSVQMLSIAGLRDAVARTGCESNRLQMPISEP